MLIILMRYRWVDVYRGIAVLFMVLLHFFVNIFPSDPLPLLVYSVRGVISIGDMAIALFLFISGVSICISIYNRKKRGASEEDAIKHILIRYSKIFALGFLLDIVLIASVQRIWWVLEAISMSGLFAMFFICFSDDMKILAILVVGLCYSYLTSIPAAYALLSSFPNGGLLGSISLSSIVLIGYMSEEYFMKRKKNALQSLIKVGVLLILTGFLLSRFMEYDRNVGTLPYVLLSSGFCLLFLVLVYWVVELKGISSGILEDFGKSALLVFVLNYPVLILATLLGFENSFSTEQSALIAVVLILLLVVASKLRKRFRKD